MDKNAKLSFFRTTPSHPVVMVPEKAGVIRIRLWVCAYSEFYVICTRDNDHFFRIISGITGCCPTASGSSARRIYLRLPSPHENCLQPLSVPRVTRGCAVLRAINARCIYSGCTISTLTGVWHDFSKLPRYLNRWCLEAPLQLRQCGCTCINKVFNTYFFLHTTFVFL